MAAGICPAARFGPAAHVVVLTPVPLQLGDGLLPVFLVATVRPPFPMPDGISDGGNGFVRDPWLLCGGMSVARRLAVLWHLVQQMLAPVRRPGARVWRVRGGFDFRRPAPRRRRGRKHPLPLHTTISLVLAPAPSPHHHLPSTT